MNRIDNIFKEGKKKVLSIYLTAGYPSLEDTVPLIRALEAAGTDLIEIGMPFSDPLADGEVIQQSSQVALANGMSLKKLFEQLKSIRESVSIPLVLMGYLNPVLQYGMKNFILKCKETGIDGLILPDLPLQVYQQEYQEMMEKADLRFIMLITPQTSEERIHAISKLSGGKGFLYMVADSSTTGARKEINQAQLDYFRRIDGMELPLPRIIGFGISGPDTFREACRYADGAIIGSAFIKAIGEPDGENVTLRAERFVKHILS